MAEVSTDVLSGAVERVEDKALTSADSGKPAIVRPTLKQLASKVVDIIQDWYESHVGDDFSRHASDGELQLSEDGVQKFRDLVRAGGDNVGTEVFEKVTELFVKDMLANRPGIAETWRVEIVDLQLRDNRIFYDADLVNDLKRDEHPLEVEDRAGEGWQTKDWAMKFAEQGFDVSNQPLEDQAYFEAIRLGLHELDSRLEMGEAHEKQAIERSGGISCPSCGGLNTSCPDGCGRDPKTGELNGTRLEQDKPALGNITYVGEGLAERDEQFRNAYMLPGEEVRLNPKMDISYVDMGALERQFGDDVLKVEETRLTLTENAWVKPEYKFEGHDGYHTAQAFEHPNGIAHEFGIMAERDDKLWFVPMTELDGEAKGAAREVVSLEGRYAEHILPEGLDGFKADVKEEPKSGEIAYIPAERGSETGPVMLAGVPWMSGVSEKEMSVANKAIDAAIDAEAPKAGLVQQAESLRDHAIVADTRDDAARSLTSISRGPNDGLSGLPQMPSRSMER